MRGKRLSGVSICLGMLVFANVAVWAQAPSNLVTIYSTLGKGSNVYSTLSGFGILGTRW